MKAEEKAEDTKVSRRLKFARVYTRISGIVTRAAGHPLASIGAILIVVIWAICGPVFHYSNTWQLVINTGTTIFTFLMVFVIQQSQNRDTSAIQIKLNELIAANEKASNRVVNIEDLTDDELLMLKEFYIKLSKLAQKESGLAGSHSLDEALDNHQFKIEIKKRPDKHDTKK